MEREIVAKKVTEIVEDRLGLVDVEITEESRFKEDLGGDSLDMVDIIMEIEKEYDISVSDMEIEQLAAENITVGSMIDFTVRKLEEKGKN